MLAFAMNLVSISMKAGLHGQMDPSRLDLMKRQNFTREGGLRDKLGAIGKKAVGDKGHTGCPDKCSTFNALDNPAVKAFKSRAQMCHAQFNGMLKEFSSLDDQFCHEQEWFEVCFEAACVICQHRLENGEPLFDLLAGIQMDGLSHG